MNLGKTTLRVPYETTLYNMTAINRSAKICKWLNKWILVVALALIILATAAIALFVSFAVHLLH